MDVKNPSKLNKDRRPLELDDLKMTKKPFIRTMQKDMEALRKGRPVKSSLPAADHAKRGVPPAELPVAKPVRRPVMPDLSKRPVSPPLKSDERLRKEAGIKERIAETQKRLGEERIRAEMARQKAEREKAEKRTKQEPARIEKIKKPELVKPEPVKEEKSRLKFVLIGLAMILIIGGIGGFLYWWNYLRVIPPPLAHYQCQDSQCISIEGEGTDECQIDEDCQPIEPVEPTVPEPLIQVDETKTIELAIGQEDLLPDKLKSVAVQEQATTTFRRILVKLVSQEEKQYMDLETLFSAWGIVRPQIILQAVATSSDAANYTLFSYGQAEGNRLGIIIALKQEIDLTQALRTWETSIKADLEPFFLGLDIETQTTVTEEFQDNLYQNIAIRYINFSVPDLSIDYAIVNNRLVITFSRESMYETINSLLTE